MAGQKLIAGNNFGSVGSRMITMFTIIVKIATLWSSGSIAGLGKLSYAKRPAAARRWSQLRTTEDRRAVRKSADFEPPQAERSG
jgi:hypothetical protein